MITYTSRGSDEGGVHGERLLRTFGCVLNGRADE